MRKSNDQQTKIPLATGLPDIEAVRTFLAAYDDVQLQIKINAYVNDSGTWGKLLTLRFFSALSRQLGTPGIGPNVAQARALLETEAIRLASAGVTAGVSDWRKILTFALKLDTPETPFPTIPKKKPA